MLRIYVAKNIDGEQVMACESELDLIVGMNIKHPGVAYFKDEVVLINNDYAPSEHSKK